MSQPVDSQALQKVSSTLQLSTVGAQETLFIDERLEQVLDVAPMVRRGLTLAGTEGIYSANMRNTHVGSITNIVTQIDAYNLTQAFALPPFPEAIPANQDLWITSLSAEVVSGDNQLSSAFFDLFIPQVHQAFGTSTTNILLAAWGNEDSFAGTFFLVKEAGRAFGAHIQPRIRVPRNAILRFHTRNNGSNSPVYQLNLLLGLFPSGMGQDGFG